MAGTTGSDVKGLLCQVEEVPSNVFGGLLVFFELEKQSGR